MPRYCFGIYDNGLLMRDEFGEDASDLQEARDQAIAVLPSLARDELPESAEHHEYRAVVRSGTAPCSTRRG